MTKKQIIKTIIERVPEQDVSKVSPYLYNGKMGLCISMFAASQNVKREDS